MKAEGAETSVLAAGAEASALQMQRPQGSAVMSEVGEVGESWPGRAERSTASSQDLCCLQKTGRGSVQSWSDEMGHQ